MSKNTTLLLVLWNVLLTALVAWGLLRAPVPTGAGPIAEIPEGAEQMIPARPRDTTALEDARIAYFYMDSIQKKYELIAEKNKTFTSKRQQLENSLKNEMAKAQARYEELMKKDHTYSTQAEVARDEKELQGLMAKIQGQQASSEEELARMEGRILTEIIQELRDFLEVYNATAEFDYIFSVQSDGQVWVGNKDLDISDIIIQGLNERYHAKKAVK